MAFYLTRFSYTPETWARLTTNPEDRREAARKYIESVGGKIGARIVGNDTLTFEKRPPVVFEPKFPGLPGAHAAHRRLGHLHHRESEPGGTGGRASL
jgi:hypothetical protein